MDIDFDSFKKDIAKFEKVWIQARKDKDRSKQAAVALAFSLTLTQSQVEIKNMAEQLSRMAVQEINEQTVRE